MNYVTPIETDSPAAARGEFLDDKGRAWQIVESSALAMSNLAISSYIERTYVGDKSSQRAAKRLLQ